MPGKVDGFEVPGRVAFGPPGRDPASPGEGRPAVEPLPPGLVEGRVDGLVEGRVEGDGFDDGRLEAEGREEGFEEGRDWTFDPVAGLRRAELPELREPPL